MNLNEHKKHVPSSRGRARVVSIYLDAHLGDRWNSFIDSEDLNASSIMRTLIEEFLDSQQKVNQLTKLGGS